MKSSQAVLRLPAWPLGQGSRLRVKPVTALGMMLVGGWLLVALLAPVIAPHDPLAQTQGIYLPPSGSHLFGTDELGRDVLSRILYGARISVPVALVVVAIALVLGAFVGAVAGYVGGGVDLVLMRIVELMLVFPHIILAMVVAAALGPSVQNAVVALVLISWPLYARVMRAAVLSIRNQEFVASSRLLGVSSLRTLLVDIAPHTIGPVVVLATVQMGQAVLLLASLSFLGLGVRPPTPEWGSMVSSGAFDFMHWWVGAFAGVAILTAVLGFNLLGDALRDRFDPHARTAAATSSRSSSIGTP